MSDLEFRPIHKLFKKNIFHKICKKYNHRHNCTTYIQHLLHTFTTTYTPYEMPLKKKPIKRTIF